jgi:hypothetical protein
MSIRKLYNDLDLLKVPISLSFKDQYFYRTFSGATLTIIGFIIIFIYFVISIKELIERSSFTVITNEYQSPYDSINLTNVPILFALTDSDGNPIELDSKLFEFSVVFSIYEQKFDQNGNSNITHLESEIEIDKCDNLKSSLDLSFFANYNISAFKCIKPSQKITLTGIFGDINGYKSIKINIKKCNNLTTNCYNNDFIESTISNSRLVVIYLGYKTNFYNKNKKDIQKNICSRSIPLSSFFNKRIFLYMSVVKYNLYDNIFISKKKEKLYFINRDIRIEYRPIYDINANDTFYNNVFAFFAFVYDGNVIEYTKKVKKFDEIASYIGNLFNIILTLFKIINSHFANKILFTDIFYEFFFEKSIKNKNKAIIIDNSSLFPFSKKQPNLLTLNSKAHDKSFNSELNFSPVNDEKIIENNNNNINSSINKTGLSKILSLKTTNFELEKKIFKKESKLYYLCPICLIKNKTKLNYLFSIKNSVCNTFSLENYIEFINTTKVINKINQENQNNLGYKHKYNYTDKNVRREINKIFNIK